LVVFITVQNLVVIDAVILISLNIYLNAAIYPSPIFQVLCL